MQDQRAHFITVLAEVKRDLEALTRGPLSDTHATLSNLNHEFVRVRGLTPGEMNFVVNIDGAAGHVAAALTLLAAAQALLKPAVLAEEKAEDIAAPPRRSDTKPGGGAARFSVNLLASGGAQWGAGQPTRSKD